jgi:hypothetical protein
MPSHRAREVRGSVVAGAVFGVLAAAVALRGADSGPGRLLLLVYLLGAPGSVAAAMLRTLEPLGRFLCALVSAVLVNATVAQTMLALQIWSIRGGVLAIGVLSSLGWFLVLRRWYPAVPVTALASASPVQATGVREAGP